MASSFSDKDEIKGDGKEDPSVNLEWVIKLPKVELHAHLSGSIRQNTLLELVREQGFTAVEERSVIATERTLSQCFTLFSVIHRVVNSRTILTRIVNEVLDDLIQQNVIYAELRTTPRTLPLDKLTKSDYVGIIVNQILATQQQSKYKNLTVRLLLSIDRSQSLISAQENLQLAKDFMKPEKGGLVVGLDFSGNPALNKFADFESVFQEARLANLKVTVQHWRITESRQQLYFHYSEIST